jgi:ABC-2 type transport system ATP-binding protein
MILAEGLTKQFDDFLAVNEVGFRVEAGKVLALLGPNGAGKTTTVRMLTSVLRPTRGWAQVAGYDVIQRPEKVRASVGVLTEQHGLYGRMNADEYLDFFGQLYRLTAPRRKHNIQQLLDTFGLAEARKRHIGDYSKGMRQKLALARALLHEPPILLLDEPTSAMDPESARLVRDSLRDLRSADRAIILCTHNLAEAEELADQIAIIRRGKIIAMGSPTALKDELLGPPEYEARFAAAQNGRLPILPPQAALCSHGEGWIRLSVDNPMQNNPIVLRSLLDQGLDVISYAEAPRSLEAVYLQAVQAPQTASSQEVRDV